MMTNFKILRFISIIIVLLIYTGYKFSQIFHINRVSSVLLALFLFSLMLGWQFIYRTDASGFDSAWFKALAWTGSLTMSLWSTFILFSIPADLFHFLNSAFGHWTQAVVPHERRKFLGQGFNFALFGLTGGTMSLGLLEVFRGPKVNEVQIPISVNAFQGLRIAQISDLHVGPTIRKDYVDEVVQRTNHTKPDFIFITGDIADAKAETISHHLAPLAKLQAKYGTYYVTGNHEYYWDAEGLIKKVESLGIIPLLNENRIIEIDGKKVLIGGITDPMGAEVFENHAPHIKKAIKTDDSVDLKILLAHRPDACFEAEELGFDLQFSGHTHAGQFFPFSMLIGLAHKYYRGLNQHGRLWVYVNQGTGYWGPANRFSVRSEITLAVLKSMPV